MRSFQGLSGRIAYGLASASLFFIQHLVAWLILAAEDSLTDLDWTFWFNPLRTVVSVTDQSPVVAFGALALTLAVDAGLVVLAFRRARWTPWAEGLAALAFVPFLQILIVLWFVAAPELRNIPVPTIAHRKLDFRTAVESLLLGAGLSVAAVMLCALVLGRYGFGLFVFSPGMVGLTAGYLGNRKADIGFWPTILLALGSAYLGGIGLVGFALEGIVCLVLAAPIAGVMVAVGALLGRALAQRGKGARGSTAASIAITPLILVAETLLSPKAAFDSIESVEVAAPPAAIWDAITHMGPIPEPPSVPFRWGLAYPVRGEIEGEGVGAIRRGVFSTGVAYERVTEWRPNEALSFIVLSDPPTMRELSPYEHVDAPHVNGYFHTIDARFTITTLPDGKTRLSLATHHELDLEPALYWVPIAEWAIHTNKLRVLDHFRDQAEASVAASPG